MIFCHPSLGYCIKCNINSPYLTTTPTIVVVGALTDKNFI